mgnify:FL=1
MTIEPSQAHTVCIRAVLPPKPAPRVLAPNLSMADEAKLIRARTHRAWGFITPVGSRERSNENRIAEAKRRRDEMADRIADLLAKGTPMTAPQIQAYFAVSDNHTRVVLTEMRKAGRVTGTKGPRGVFLWAINEGAA